MTWVEVMALTDLTPEVPVLVEVAGKRIALVRVDEDVYAVGDRCSHAEASLSEGEVFDTEIECPRHGATFDLRTGKPLSLPATRPVPTYETKVEDGVVYLAVEGT